jgi:phospholipid transport system substrate-binding protein
MFCQARKGRYFVKLALIVLLGITPQFTLAASSGPLTVIRSGTERALHILQEAHKGDGKTLRARKSEILTIVDEYFNFEEMGKRALGRSWKEQSPENRLEFIKLFKLLLFNTYISRVERYTGENEKAVYDSEKLEGEYALVKTHVTLQGNQNVALDYRLHQENGQWKVYDVVVEGISLVENYRSQFASILSNGTFDVLLKKLREKVAQQV